MSKKENKLNYSKLDELFLERLVVVGLKGGTNLSGVVHHVGPDSLVLVTEPKSSLDIETQIVHTVVMKSNVDFIQFKTERGKV